MLRGQQADAVQTRNYIREMADAFKNTVLTYGVELFKGVGNQQASQTAANFLSQNLQNNNFFSALQADDLAQLAKDSVDLVARVMREDVSQAIAGKVAPNI